MTEMVKAMADQSRKTIPIREGDYCVDGILHCGKCGTPKQYRRQVGNITIDAMCLCRCEAERYRKEEERAKAMETQLRIERNRADCFPSARMWEDTFRMDDAPESKISQGCRRFVDNFPDKMGLLFYGGMGTGKTFMESCIANALIDRGFTVRLDVPRGYADESMNHKADFREMLQTVDLLIIDDFSSERQTEWMQETIFYMINDRWESGKPIIASTNLTAAEMKDPGRLAYWQARSLSRLLDCCLPVLIDGEDRRRKNGRDHLTEWRRKIYG